MPTATEMKVTREDLNPCTIQLQVVCSPDQVRNGFARALKSFAKNMRLPGFRPGHAPVGMIDKMIPADELKNAAAEEIVNTVFRKILQDENIQPHDAPNVNLTTLDREQETCEFTAKVPLKPIVELGEYKGIPVSTPTIEVSERDIDEYLEDLRKRAGKRESVTDRGAANGDMVVVNLKLDKEDGEGKNFMSVVGQTFPSLDKALQDMRAEEMKVENLEFPADFQDKDWAGKKAKAKITIKSINAIQAPDLDDEFAKKAGKDLKSENLAELREKLRERILATKTDMAREFALEQIQEELLNRSTIHVPDNMWESVANQRLRELAQEAQQQGKTIEDYAKSNGMTVDEMVEHWQHEAQIHVRRAVAAREIFAKERLRLTNEDLNQALIQMAMEYRVNPADLVQAMQKNKNFQELEIRGVFKKVMDFLYANAEIGEGEAAKPAAKKAAKAKAEPAAAEPSAEEKPKKSKAKKAD